MPHIIYFVVILNVNIFIFEIVFTIKPSFCNNRTTHTQYNIDNLLKVNYL